MQLLLGGKNKGKTSLQQSRRCAHGQHGGCHSHTWQGWVGMCPAQQPAPPVLLCKSRTGRAAPPLHYNVVQRVEEGDKAVQGGAGSPARLPRVITTFMRWELSQPDIEAVLEQGGRAWSSGLQPPGPCSKHLLLDTEMTSVWKGPFLPDLVLPMFRMCHHLFPHPWCPPSMSISPRPAPLLPRLFASHCGSGRATAPPGHSTWLRKVSCPQSSVSVPELLWKMEVKERRK